jgi:hypothetical protein
MHRLIFVVLLSVCGYSQGTKEFDMPSQELYGGCMVIARGGGTTVSDILVADHARYFIRGFISSQDKQYCLPQDVSLFLVVRAVLDYGQEYPSYADPSGRTLLVASLHKKYPCH